MRMREGQMSDADWLKRTSAAFRLTIASSWLAPELWHDRQESAVHEAMGGGVDWEEYLRLVDRHRTPAVSWAALKRVSRLAVPEPVQRELQGRSEACRMQAVGHALLLAEVLKGFNGDGIAGMPMKGPLLSQELYGDIGLRQSRDVDIMVEPQDVLRAQACLQKLGWHADASSFPMSPRQREAQLRHEHHIAYVRPHGACCLELHWRAIWDAPDDSSRRWARSVACCWRGYSYQAMNPIDQALYLCSHGSDHRWFRAKWLGDMARMSASGLVDWEAALEEARRTNQERPVLVCLRLLREVHGFPVPAAPASARELPSFLIDRAVVELTAAPEPKQTSILFRLLKARYDRLLRPQSTWKSLAALAYSRPDFRVLHLPDSLFWAYAPLRPFLWVWRRLLRGSPVTTSGK
jgi:hypothetical protein